LIQRAGLVVDQYVVDNSIGGGTEDEYGEDASGRYASAARDHQ